VLKDPGICFACGKGNPHGLHLDIRKTGEGVELDYAVPERYCGWEDVVHGGIVATLLDELAVWACTEAGQHAVTAELNVRFRQPLRVGQRVRGYGRVVGERGRLLVTESRLVGESGNVIAEATGKMMHVEAEATAND
jgi:uncharacterized protein (TIGR00369 family)